MKFNKLSSLLENKLAWEADIWHLIIDRNIPLRSSILKRLKSISKIKTAYHICSLDNLKYLKKCENTNKAISTFTKGNMELSDGVHAGNEILVELSGEQVLKYLTDIYSKPEKNSGTRWVPLYNISEEIYGEFEKSYIKILNSIFNLNEREITKQPILSAYRSMSQKEKGKSIKAYFDGIEKLYKKIGFENLFSDKFEPGFDEQTYNEVLVQNIKINNVYLIAGDGWDSSLYTPNTFESFDTNIQGDLQKFINNGDITGVIYRDDIELIDDNFVDVQLEF